MTHTLRVSYREKGGGGVTGIPPTHKFEYYVIIASTATVGSIIIDLTYYS